MSTVIETYRAFRGLYARASGVVLGAVGAAAFLALEMTVVMPGLVAACISTLVFGAFLWRVHCYLAGQDARCQQKGNPEWSVSLNGFAVGTIPDHVVAMLRAQAACELRLYVQQLGHYLGMVVNTLRLSISVVFQGGALAALGAATFAPDAFMQFATALLLRSPSEWQAVLPNLVSLFVIGTICGFCFLVALGFHTFTDYNAFDVAVGERAMRHLNFHGKGTVTIERCAQYRPPAPGFGRLQDQT